MDPKKVEKLKWGRAALFSLSLSLIMTFLLSSTSSAESEYEKWRKEELGQFQEFKDKRDKAFTAHLKKQWEEFRIFAGEKAYEKPKPKKIPVARKKSPQEEKPFAGKIVKVIPLPRPIPAKKTISVVEPLPLQKKPTVKIKPLPDIEPDITKEPKSVKKPELATEPLLVAPEQKKPLPLPITAKGEKLELDFYGTKLSFRYDPSLKASLGGRIDAKAISSFWETLSKADFDGMLEQLRRYKQELKLNDWGYHLLTHRTGEGIYGKRNKNEVNLFAWFILSKANYDTKVGYNDNEIFILSPSRNSIYGVSFLKLDGKKYYAISFDGKKTSMGSLYTYKGKYPGSSDLMDYGIYEMPEVAGKVIARDLKFQYRGKTYIVPVKYNKMMPEYFEYYPQTEFEVYFNASVSPEAGYSLVEGLRPIIEGKTEGEAVNIIIRFVQTAFEYKTDDSQFGREKYLLPDETLFYPYSDCEDRSILFAYLVDKLVGLEVVGLHYPGHMATAVRFNSDIKGDWVRYKGKKYIVTDPTYINADIGTAMPQFKNVMPKIIPIGKRA
ncbi:MAG: hypothetical protein RQ824_08465 [bacterium]|nr:hypothetical protein [bacterium]